MRKTILRYAFFVGLFSLVLPLSSSDSYAGIYEIDNAMSKISFKVRRLSEMVEGRFKSFRGIIELDPRNSLPSQVQATIDVSSIDSNADNEYLKSPSFLHAEKFPSIVFKSKRIEADKIIGDLTFHGVTKEVVFDYVFRGISGDRSGNQRAQFEATTILDRKEFGILFSRFFDRGGVLLSNTILMMIEFQAIARK